MERGDIVLRVKLEKPVTVEPDKNAILNYLKSAKVVAAAPGSVRDEITNTRTNIAILGYSDGDFEWTSIEIYHLEKYNHKLPRIFLEHIRKRVH